MDVTRALIGKSGFVGGNLAEQLRFDDCFRSTDIERIEGQDYDLLVCAGAYGEKWRANLEPDKDWLSIERLIRSLRRVTARQAVLISTVDVFAEPAGVDELAEPDPSRLGAYGKHRLLLERFFLEHFTTLIVRLPALFGPGLKKNAIYDLMHDHQVSRLHPLSGYQFYDVRKLWKDIEKARALGAPCIHLVTEPLGCGELAERCFGRRLTAPTAVEPARYDVRSRHAEAWGGAGGYLTDRAGVVQAIREFVETLARNAR